MVYKLEKVSLAEQQLLAVLQVNVAEVSLS